MPLLLIGRIINKLQRYIHLRHILFDSLDSNLAAQETLKLDMNQSFSLVYQSRETILFNEFITFSICPSLLYYFQSRFSDHLAAPDCEVCG